MTKFGGFDGLSFLSCPYLIFYAFLGKGYSSWERNKNPLHLCLFVRLVVVLKSNLLQEWVIGEVGFRSRHWVDGNMSGWVCLVLFTIIHNIYCDVGITSCYSTYSVSRAYD